MNSFDNLMNGQPPCGFGSFSGSMALGSLMERRQVNNYLHKTANATAIQQFTDD